MLARQRQELILDAVRSTGVSASPSWPNNSASPT
jgi:hypothetical protein